MSIVFVDRQSTYPNRCLITPQNGNPYYAVVERADEPIVAGTPLNAETMNGLADDISAQVLEKIPTESVNYPGCYYRMVEDEQEWINPPMHAGVEYRTAERHGGYPVYIKRFRITLPMKNTPYSGEIVSSDTEPYIVGLTGTIEDPEETSMYVHPFFNPVGLQSVTAYVSSSMSTQNKRTLKLHVITNVENWAGGAGNFYIKYTK
jgi:hypothetical protein